MMCTVPARPSHHPAVDSHAVPVAAMSLRCTYGVIYGQVLCPEVVLRHIISDIRRQLLHVLPCALAQARPTMAYIPL